MSHNIYYYSGDIYVCPAHICLHSFVSGYLWTKREFCSK